jgi:hypothetical protein
VVEGKLAGVIRNDSASVDDYSLHERPFPVLAPPRNVVTDWITLRDIRLPPPNRSPIPRRGVFGDRALRHRGHHDRPNRRTFNEFPPVHKTSGQNERLNSNCEFRLPDFAVTIMNVELSGLGFTDPQFELSFPLFPRAS